MLKASSFPEAASEATAKAEAAIRVDRGEGEEEEARGEEEEAWEEGEEASETWEMAWKMEEEGVSSLVGVEEGHFEVEVVEEVGILTLEEEVVLGAVFSVVGVEAEEVGHWRVGNSVIWTPTECFVV